jgi:hypothetical protein
MISAEGSNRLSDISVLGPEGGRRGEGLYGRRGDGLYDPDEDEEEEFQEIVVDEEEEEASIAENVEGEGEVNQHTSWPHPSHDASSPHVSLATPQVLYNICIQYVYSIEHNICIEYTSPVPWSP